MGDNLPVIVVVLPLLAAMVTPALALWRSRWVRYWTLGILSVCSGASIGLLVRVLASGAWRYEFGGWPAPWGIELVVDPLSAGMAVLVSGFALLSAIYGWDCPEPEGRLGPGSFHALYLLLTAGLLGIVLTGDLFNLYVFLEIASLAAYALVAAGAGPKADLAAFRYLIIGSVGALLWVFGVGYVYALTGTLNMADAALLWPAAAGSRAAAVAVSLMVAGLLIKMAVFPMHGWQPDAYASAPPRIMPFVGGVMAKVSAYVLFRVLYFVFQASGAAGSVLDVLGWIGALTVVAGSVLAVSQKDVRRMLAYSSVAQIGYILIGFSVGGRLALTGALLHIINHAVMKSCLFMAAGSVQRRFGSCRIEDFKGLSTVMPKTAAAFSIAALSMIGLPPGCGFFSKWYLLRGTIEAGAWPFVAALVLSSLLSMVYFFRLIEKAYLDGSDEPETKEPITMLVPMMALSAAVVFLGIFNQGVVSSVVDLALPIWGVG